VLFGGDDAFEYDAKAVDKVLVKGDRAGYAVLAKLRPLLAETPGQPRRCKSYWMTFCASNALGMGKVAQPIRVAVTGTTISPAIGETLVFLGREKTLARIGRCLRAAGNNG